MRRWLAGGDGVPSLAVLPDVSFASRFQREQHEGITARRVTIPPQFRIIQVLAKGLSIVDIGPEACRSIRCILRDRGCPHAQARAELLRIQQDGDRRPGSGFEAGRELVPP